VPPGASARRVPAPRDDPSTLAVTGGPNAAVTVGPRDDRATTVSVREGALADAAMLTELGIRTFRETYAETNAEQQLEAYVAEAYREDLQAAELADPTVTYLVAEVDRTPVGFVLVRTAEAPDPIRAHDPLQLERIYVDREHQGVGAGAALVRAVLDRAATGGHDVVWLTVWERNPAAIAYYRRWGFEQVGEVQFVLGTEQQTDLVMAWWR
jgi:diamine N-acetyltransferase